MVPCPREYLRKHIAPPKCYPVLPLCYPGQSGSWHPLKVNKVAWFALSAQVNTYGSIAPPIWPSATQGWFAPPAQWPRACQCFEHSALVCPAHLPKWILMEASCPALLYPFWQVLCCATQGSHPSEHGSTSILPSTAQDSECSRHPLMAWMIPWMAPPKWTYNAILIL